MAYYITNGEQDITYNLNAWPLLLELSFHFGWTAKGTKLDSEEKWTGSYLTMSGAYVDSEDALNLAAALERALPEIPDVDIGVVESVWGSNIINRGSKSIEEALDEMTIYLNPPRGESKSKLLLRFGGEGEKEKLREFIKLCREGKGFTIN